MEAQTRHFWGVPSILRELGYKNGWDTWRRLQKQGFPAYSRRGVGRWRGKTIWYTNSTMILAWQLRRAHDERLERSTPQAIEVRRIRYTRRGRAARYGNQSSTTNDTDGD